MSDIDARISAIPYWTGHVECQPLHGGLSNESYTVVDRAGKFADRADGGVANAQGQVPLFEQVTKDQYELVFEMMKRNKRTPVTML